MAFVTSNIAKSINLPWQVPCIPTAHAIQTKVNTQQYINVEKIDFHIVPQSIRTQQQQRKQQALQQIWYYKNSLLISNLRIVCTMYVVPLFIHQSIVPFCTH